MMTNNPTEEKAAPAIGEKPTLFILVKWWEGVCTGTEIALTKEEIAEKWKAYTDVDLLKYNDTIEEQPNPYEEEYWFGTIIEEKEIDEKFFRQLESLHHHSTFLDKQWAGTAEPKDAPQEEDDTKFTEDQRDMVATKADSTQQQE